MHLKTITIWAILAFFANYATAYPMEIPSEVENYVDNFANYLLSFFGPDLERSARSQYANLGLARQSMLKVSTKYI